MRRLILITVCLAILCITAGTTVAYFAFRAENRKEVQEYKLAQKLLDQQKPHQALDIIERYRPQLSEESQEINWLPMLVSALTQIKDGESLLPLYQTFPKAFEQNEEAVLLLSAALLAEHRLENFQTLRDKWKDRAKELPEWFNLESDRLISEGKYDEAIAHLRSKEFKGPADTGRLIRLALLYSRSDLSESWNILNQALEKDPKNTDAATYRAQILEAMHKPDLARIEYLSVIQKDPSNANLICQLGEFYRRNHRYGLAVEAWRQGLGLDQSDQLWVKTLFWSKMTLPVKLVDENPPHTGELAPFVNYLYEMSSDQFWDSLAFDQLPHRSTYLKTMQETFWLRLCQLLLENEQSEANELIDSHSFLTWEPELENSLQQILTYRKYGLFSSEKATLSSATQQSSSHQFFKTLRELADSPNLTPPEEIKNLLNSPYAFPAAFLAAGWIEAALTWPIPTQLPDELPDWLAFAYTQALRYSRGPTKALYFAMKQKATPSLSLLIGELLVTNGNSEKGLDYLLPLSQLDDEIAVRAAWLVSLVEIEKKEFEKACKTIHAHPSLAQSILGRETLARIALKQGDITRADTLYGELENDSFEAKFYLARRAYANRNWEKAIELTEALIIEFPDNPELHKDLQKLQELSKKEQS